MTRRALPSIALIDAVDVAIPPIRLAFDRRGPEADLVNLFDDSLSPDCAAGAHLTSSMAARILALARYAAQTGTAGILFTCSAFGPAIEAAARALAPLPVLKPLVAMYTDGRASPMELRAGGLVVRPRSLTIPGICR